MWFVDKNQLRGIIEHNINEILSKATVTPSLNWDTYSELVEEVSTDLHNGMVEASNAAYERGVNDGLAQAVERDHMAEIRKYWENHSDELSQIARNHNGILLELHNGKKITAIKILRQLTGCGLKLAKDTVERVA